MSLARSGSSSTASIPKPLPLPPGPRRRQTSNRYVAVKPRLRHPTPSNSDIHASYGSNIMNLEQRAEEMSQGGSDIGEEIRRMNEAEKERSRQNSIQSSHQGDVNGVRGGAGGMFGMESTRSRQSSAAGPGGIVDVNGSARWGGYSPGGYFTSPTGSVGSRSWSHASMARKASASGSSRLAQMEPMMEGRPLDSPLAPSHSSMSRQTSQASQTSFGQRYDQIASEIEERLGNITPSPPKHTSDPHRDPDMEHQHTAEEEKRFVPPPRPHSSSTFRELETAFQDFDGVHYAPDVDDVAGLGDHGEASRKVSTRASSGALSSSAASMLRMPQAYPVMNGAPPPQEGMVYYPAPVPRMLNLPKRLSQLPSANVQARRRTQLLGQLGPEARNSAPWLLQSNLSDADNHQSDDAGGLSHEPLDHPQPYLNERMSVGNMRNLPPQLRASVFFDHQSVSQNVEVKSESAVATLDNILRASATAPVNAFIDHPYAGDVRQSVFAPEKAAARRSTATLGASSPLAEGTPKAKKRRSSIGNLLRRASSGDKLTEQLQENGSRISLQTDFNDGSNKLQKRKSQMSVGDELAKRKSQMSLGDELDDQHAEPVHTPRYELPELELSGGLIEQAQNGSPREGEGHSRQPSEGRPESAPSVKELSMNEQIKADFKEGGDEEEGDPVYAAPTTLLAELQVRKANLKSRNRTAVTAYPNGMHSTLLQLDAVEQIQQKKRRNHRTALAWEGPAQQPEDDDENDDVPLGMLYPDSSGILTGKRKLGDGKDWDRPLGLMEQRELENEETLFSRRNRLQGLPPDHGRPKRQSRVFPDTSQIHLAGQPDAPPEGEEEGEEDDEHAGETMAQRQRRVKTKSVLDTTISDFAPKAGSRPVSTFTDDLLSQFGGLNAKESKADTHGKGAVADTKQGTSTPASEEQEETLGQRRARLQREREAAGDQPAATRPILRSANSLANLLATNPVAPRNPSREQKLQQGTLLHASAQQQAKQKAELYNTNVRSSSFYLEKPLVNASRPPTASRHPSTGGLLGQQAGGFGAAGGFAGGMYNNGLGGTVPQMPSFYASPTAGMVGPPTYQPMGAQQMFNPAAYQALAGQAPGFGFGYGAPQMPYGTMPMGMNMGVGVVPEQMQPKQRDAIDRWRLSVAQ